MKGMKGMRGGHAQHGVSAFEREMDASMARMMQDIDQAFVIVFARFKFFLSHV